MEVSYLQIKSVNSIETASATRVNTEQWLYLTNLNDPVKMGGVLGGQNGLSFVFRQPNFRIIFLQKGQIAVAVFLLKKIKLLN
jgi:hypothetical protein